VFTPMSLVILNKVDVDDTGAASSGVNVGQQVDLSGAEPAPAGDAGSQGAAGADREPQQPSPAAPVRPYRDGLLRSRPRLTMMTEHFGTLSADELMPACEPPSSRHSASGRRQR
jgi:hypothetical protein